MFILFKRYLKQKNIKKS